MKQLVLVRHGKSSWEYNVSDRDRPLLQRGVNDALLVSEKWVLENTSIDFIYSSPANRALHSATIFLRKLDFPLERFQLSNMLYDFSGDSVLQFIKELDNDLESVMIFGHNHAFTFIANSLGNSYIENVPTNGLVQLQFGINSWEEIDKGTTIKTIFPKHFK